MLTREEAIEHLTALGLHAVARDWALGATVFVGTAGEEVGGVTAYKRVMYIFPHDGSWTSLEIDAPRPDDEKLMSLEEACERVRRILTTGS